ncbi:MAG TPA: ABC transporter permease [Longimicrobiaceae bacterium]|nr:ABC transporter permease [Longimicrobiaceae bacterium]
MERSIQDVRYAVRMLLRTPGFTLVALLTLGLGIGATAAIFSALHAVVLRPFPFPHPERVMVVARTWRGDDLGNMSAANFADVRARTTVFDAVTAVQYSSFNLADEGTPERVVGARVSDGFFRVFGIAPALGRTFTPEEDRPGRAGVVVLSHKLWERRFGADPAVVGSTFRLNGEAFTVVGVMPGEMDYVENNEELWVPIAFTAERLATRDEHFLEVYGRLKPGATPERAGAELDALGRRLAEQYPQENAESGIGLASLTGQVIGDYRQRLLVLLGAVAFVLLIACANVANLMLARGTARGKEIAIRAALGAERGRIVRQLLTESVVLGVGGAVVGLTLAFWGLQGLLAASPPGVPRLEQARLDAPVLAFTLAVSIGCSLLFGAVPALRAARTDLQSTLKEGGRGASAGRDRVRAVLVAGEVALALALLVGSGLLIRSAVRMQNVDTGYDAAGVLTGRVSLPADQYRDPLRAEAAFARLVRELEATPGVASAAVVSQAPLTPGGGSNGVIPEGRALDITSAIDAPLRIVTPGYFQTMRIPLRAGRGFTAEDRAGAPKVMVISERLAQQAFPGEDPIGKRIVCCEGTPEEPGWKTVVGVAADVRSGGPANDVRPDFYLPVSQVPPEAWDWIQRTMAVVARARSGDAAALAGPMRAAVRAVDPELPLFDLFTMEQRMGRSLARARFNTVLLSLLGAVGMLLAAVGIYGVTAYFVSLRTREIGIRVALGARPRSVLSLVLRRGMALTAAGVAAGTLASLGLTRFLAGQLFGVSPTDPATFGAVIVFLAGVALLASWIPARRAARVDPMAALRQE